MRISNKMVYSNYAMNLMNSEEIINKKNSQISTGRKILQPSDDPSGAIRAMLYRTNLTEISQYTFNSNNAKLLLNGTDDTLVKCDDYLQRAYELVVNGGNDTNSPETWEPMAAEIDKIRDGLIDLANTNIDGRYIFAGEKILEPAYTVRASVTGDVRDLELNPITIDSRNNQFKVKLDSGDIVTISLTTKVYNGTAGKTLDDLAEDIHKQLSQAGFKTSVYARATPDGKISFYAGDQPSDGEHTLVLKDGPAIKYTGKSPGPFVANQITLAGDANNGVDFYSGWNITITKGTGAGQTRTIQSYSGPGHTATALDSNWTINPDFDSEYVITPPLEGATIAVPPPTANTVALDPATRSGLANFYNGMDITVTDINGVSQTRKITGYNNATGEVTVGIPAWSLPNVTDFTITPHLSGNVTGSMGLPFPSITLDAAAGASLYDDFYNGASVIATYADGRTETRHIIDYNGGTQVASLDGGDWPMPPVSYKICDTALDQLGFENKATTKELQGASINGLVKVNGKYPLAEIAAGATGVNDIILNIKDQKADNYYNNWTIKIIKGVGAGQTSTISAYTNAGNTATVVPAWTPLTPDTSSVYTLEPPLMGISVAPEQSTTTVGAGANDITLPFGASTIDDHYNNWTITITSGPSAGATKTITDYDGATGLASIAPSAWMPAFPDPAAGANYTLTPPSNQITFTNASAVNDFYKGMPVTIYDGTGKGQIRTITAYDGVNQVATLDKPWDTLPDTSSKYTIDANYYINTNNKFKIKVGQELTQEISLDGGEYSPQDLASMVQSKINARGGQYANIQVSASADNRLRIVHQDPDLNDDDNPLDIKLEAGSNADLLWKLGFDNGIVSEEGMVNFEGNKAGMDYDINVNAKVRVNVVGDSLFDPIFDHLKKISMDLRAGNNADLTSVDLINLKDDLDRVLAIQAEVGSKVNRMEKSIDHLTSFELNMNKLLSDVEDTDISKVVIDLKMQETAYQAALQSGARILQMTLLDYLR